MNKRKENRNLFNLFEPILIVTFWILLFCSPLLFGNEQIVWKNIFNIWKEFAFYLVLFLLNRFVFLRYLFFKNKRLLFVIANVIFILALTYGHRQYQNDNTNILPHEMNNAFPPPPEMQHASHPHNPPPMLPPFLGFAILSVLIVGFDTSLVLSVKWVRTEQKRVKAEKENAENQLAFLRNQVSPHFFMNTLNNIHALIDFDTEEAKESIIRLSKLMRHLLYDSEAEQIPLAKEIDFISNYIDLMKLRFSEKVKINLQFPAQFPDKKIPPLLFTSYVENAFKHGISYQNSSYINIRFSRESDNLIFEIENSKHQKLEDNEQSGIGIRNSQKRLDLIYGDRYLLKIEDTNKKYKLYLSIPL